MGRRRPEYEPLITAEYASTTSPKETVALTSLHSRDSPSRGPSADAGAGGGKLSTFFGVFVPCVLSIFSVVLFLRMGYVLGQTGLVLSLVLLCIAYSIVFLTTLSLSAISTNGVVKGGGAYFMISRSLGPEFGGAIGIIFYFANIFASGLYVIGFVETLIQTVPELEVSFGVTYGLRTAVNIFNLVVSLVGAGAFAKASFAIFIVVMIAVLAVLVNFFAASARDNLAVSTLSSYNDTVSYTGFSRHTLVDNLDPDLQNDYTTGQLQTIPTIFGVLFNGVTGIMAGANMSGDLKNASESIPRGTFQALGFTFFVYVLFFFFSSATCSRALLVHNYGYLQEINKVPPLVMVGVFSATLSAALSTLIGASRICQAISRDNLLGDSFLFLSKEEREPIRAVILSWALVQLVLLFSTITTIAPVVAMLFLLSYAITNFACFALTVVGTVNFRPRFKLFSWHTALAGGVSCIVVMFVVDPLWATVAFILFLLCFGFIHWRQPDVDWGDVSQALIYHQVRKYLLRLHAQTTKFWRPQVLLLVHNPRSHFNMVLFANDMKKGGLFVLGHVVIDDFVPSARDELEKSREAWSTLDRVAKVKAFVDCIIASSLRQGVRAMLQTSGLGGMRPNIICLGFHDEKGDTDQLTQWRDELERRKRNALIVRLGRVQEANELMQQFAALPDHRAERPDGVPVADFVGTIDDALMLGKNVAVMRHFAWLPTRLEDAKAAIKHGEAPWTIDMWPLTVSPGSIVQHTYEVIFQLGSIVHMVPRWRGYARLRVCHLVEWTQEIPAERDRIRELLADLRVFAEVKVIALDQQPRDNGDGDTGAAPAATSSLRMLESMKPGDDTVARVREINGVMRRHTARTAVMFTYLPPTENFMSKPARYMEVTSELSKGLPPVVMVHGVEKVVTYSIDAL